VKKPGLCFLFDLEAFSTQRHAFGAQAFFRQPHSDQDDRYRRLPALAEQSAALTPP
jgi:hypothetical protein